MSNIKVSVVIPVYNVEHYLEKCLKSVVEQSLKEIEIIVVNDGSTDNSVDIINRFGDKDDRIVIINKSNGGVSSARNAGLDIARGEYIAYIDADDWIEQGYLYDTYSKAKKLGLDVVVTDFFWYNDNDECIYNNDGGMNEEGYINGKTYVEQYVKEAYSPIVTNKLFALHLYRDNNIRYPESINLGEDLATSLRLYFFVQKIGKLNSAYYHYVTRTNSLNRRRLSDKQLLETKETFRIISKVYAQDMRMMKILEEYKLWYYINIYLFNLDMNVNGVAMRDMISELLEINKRHCLPQGSYKLRALCKVLQILPYFNVVVLVRYVHSILAK